MANEHTLIHPAKARLMSDEDPEDEDALPSRSKKEMGRKRKRTIAML
uniref:Adenosine deaminase RNA specific B1 n=1 Tax=Nomascus leucogenys TaxID=61853 RepID=A0A2I3GV21_NOMLE